MSLEKWFGIWILTATMLVAIPLGIVAVYDDHQNQKKAATERAAKIKNFQDRLDDAMKPWRPEDLDEKIPGANWPACMAWGNWATLQFVRGELEKAGFTLEGIQREEQFLSVARNQGLALAWAVAYGQGVLDCGDMGNHVAVAEAAFHTLLEVQSTSEPPQPLWGDLRKVLIREIAPSVKQALAFLRSDRKGSEPDFHRLRDSIVRDDLTAAELGISWRQREEIFLAAKRQGGK